MAQLRDFQEATADRIMEYYDSSETNKRYLLADEVGLGKTVVAGEVIDRFVKREREQSQQECVVYYVCGNLALIAQNEKKLRDGFESFESYEDKRSRHDDMSRLVLSFIRDNYKRDFDKLIKILKGISIWMLAQSEGKSDEYKEEMFYCKKGKVRKLAKNVSKKKFVLIIKLFEQCCSVMNIYRYNRLQREKDIYHILLAIYKKVEGMRLNDSIEKTLKEVDDCLDNYKFYAKEDTYNALIEDDKVEQWEREKEILSKLICLAATYDSLTDTKTISFQSLTPRTSIEKTSSGTWVERAAAGIVYYKWKKILKETTFPENMDECIRGNKDKEEFDKILPVIKNGAYGKFISDDAQQAMFLFRNISDSDVERIMNGAIREKVKAENNAINILKDIMTEMSRYSLEKEKENKSVLVVVDEFQNYSKILGNTSEECQKIREALLQNNEHYVLLLSATPFHFANANRGKDSKYSSGLKEIDSEVELIMEYVLGKDNYVTFSGIKEPECRFEYLYKNGISRTERVNQVVKDGNMTLRYNQDLKLIKEDLEGLVPAVDIGTVFETIEQVKKDDIVFFYGGYLYVYRYADQKYYLANEELITLFSESQCWEYDGYVEDDEEEEDSKKDKNKDIDVTFYQIKTWDTWDEELEYDEEYDESDNLDIQDICLVELDCRPETKKYYLKNIREKMLPISYIKDTPWILSFIQGYKGPNYSSNEKYMLSADKIRRYEEIPATHARFRKFQNIVLDKVYEYLFIPPSKPDYKLWGIYENADYSKSLVFSHNYHTPRAFSAMLSYESERRNLEGEYRNPESKCLNLENPKDCEDIASAQNGYEDRTRYDLSGKKYSKETEKIEEECIQAEIDRYRDLMKSMEAGFKEEESPYKRAVEKARAGYENLEKDDLFCLGSMAGYFLELAKEFAWKETLFDEYLKKYLLALYSVFTTKEAYGILCKVGNEDDSYMEKIYKYNAQGNIHAVLDEYFHLILEEEHLTFESFQDNSNENFKELEKKYFSIIKYYMNSHRFRVKVNTTDGASINIYTNFAQGITGDEAKVDTQKALKHKMVCFNSPFRPFVFTTTSVGAEGLDFHWYCSNIYHWALEMNPEKFQQKEGRINRFHCHGVRRNLGRDLPDKSWAEIYLATSKKEGDPFWPEWVYEGNGKNGPYAELKRHTMYYPGSFEDESYSDMIQNMKLYRAVVDGNYLCPLNRIQTKK